MLCDDVQLALLYGRLHSDMFMTAGLAAIVMLVAVEGAFGPVPASALGVCLPIEFSATVLTCLKSD